MRMIDPLTITDAVLTASNVPENDHPVWSPTAAYTVGQRVILISTHSVYEALVANTGVNPATDTGATWLRIGATNRWKAFDRRIRDQVTRAGSITYTLAPTSICDGAAFLGLDAAQITLRVKQGTTTIWTATVALVDRTMAVDWYTWFMAPIDYDTEKLVLGFPGYPGNSVEVEVTSSGTARLGQLVIGRTHSLGITAVGTTIGIIDYSRKERDDFGNPIIVERDMADRVEFRFAFPPEDGRRIRRLVAQVRARPAVYFSDADADKYGTMVYGFHRGFEVPLEAGLSYASLEIEGLT